MSVIYSEKFEKAFQYTIANEGGYVFDKNDPGGATKYGISQRSYPALNIKHLTLDEAKKIYYCDYWLKGKFEQIDDKNVATQLFDFSVNFGIRAATIVLQRSLRACGVLLTEDGICGPATIYETRRNFASGSEIRGRRILSTDCGAESETTEVS